MNSWSENIELVGALRDARVAETTKDDGRGSPASPDSWRSGYDLGKIEGEKLLSEQMLKQRADLHELVRGALDSLRQAVPQVIHDTENTLVALALEVAQKLVSDMPVSVPMIEAAIRDALTRIEGTAEFTVRLHPADLDLLQKAGSPLLTSVEGANEFRFLASPEVARGGCLVQTRFGTVDARRETKFDLMKRSLIPC